MKIGVIIARFQVPYLHDGHTALIQKASAENDRLVFLLGISDVDARTAENPLLFSQRASMLRHAYADEFSRGTFDVQPLFNMKSNEEWTTQIDRLIGGLYPGAVARIYVGRDSVVEMCYTSKRMPIVTIEQVSGKSGTQMRAELQAENTVPFMRGQSFALQFQYPHAYVTVDIACVRYSVIPPEVRRAPGAGTVTLRTEKLREVLLIKRSDTGVWCLPGGFVDPKETLEAAARRELFEETKLTCEGRLTYIGSAVIPDWRYRGRDSIVSSLFLAEYSFGVASITEEALDSRWFDFMNGDINEVDVAHRELVTLLKQHFTIPQIQETSCSV